MAEGNILASAAVSASYNMVLQLLFRLLTFVLNAFILHFISKDMLGVVNVRLMLLFSTIIFISGEGFRRACMSKAPKDSWPSVINLIWCTVPLGLFSAAILGLVWSHLLEQPDPLLVPYYHLAVAAYAVSAVITLLAEPLFISAQILLFVKLKVIVEGAAIALRCLLTVFLIWRFPNLGLINFCIAQLVYSISYTGAYYAYFIHYTRSHKGHKEYPFSSSLDFLPSISQKKRGINLPLANLTWSFLKQSFLKQILTEGERYVMTVFGVLSFGDQGIYDVINNLGSLAARFIFLPLEDAAYLVFSHTLQRGKYAKEQDKNVVDLASQVLESLLKVVVLIGMTILIFGYAYSFLLLDLYGGDMLSSSSGPRLLRTYCVYVLLLAINGISEGFVFSVMAEKEVNKYNRMMLVFSLVFLSSSLYLTKLLGSIGFILANCLNMSARITHSIYFIMRYYRGTELQPLKGVVPSAAIIIAFSSSFLITSLSEYVFLRVDGWLPRILHVGVGGACLLLVLFTIYITEYKLLTFVKLQYTKYKEAKKESTKKE